MDAYNLNLLKEAREWCEAGTHGDPNGAKAYQTLKRLDSVLAALAPAPALSGEVVKMGDLSLDGDKWTGIVVSCTREALRDMGVNLIGKTVVITE